MTIIPALFVLVNFALLSVDADWSKIEANHGEDVTLSFTMDKVEGAGRLRIRFTSESTNETRLIAQRCGGSERCDFVEEPGVKLRVEKGRASLSIQKVNSSRSGLYKARTFFGKYMYERNVTLVVTKASFSSSSAPPHTSIPKPPDSSDLHLLWLCAVIPLVIVILGVIYFWKRRRIPCSQKENWKAIAVIVQQSP